MKMLHYLVCGIFGIILCNNSFATAVNDNKDHSIKTKDNSSKDTKDKRDFAKNIDHLDSKIDDKKGRIGSHKAAANVKDDLDDLRNDRKHTKKNNNKQTV